MVFSTSQSRFGLVEEIQLLLARHSKGEIGEQAVLDSLDERVCSVLAVIEELQKQECPEAFQALLLSLIEGFEEYQMALESLEELFLAGENSQEDMREVISVLSAADQKVQRFKVDLELLEEKFEKDFPVNRVG
jgi:hypothetical protein